jgi:hypothetical protein
VKNPKRHNPHETRSGPLHFRTVNKNPRHTRVITLIIAGSIIVQYIGTLSTANQIRLAKFIPIYPQATQVAPQTVLFLEKIHEITWGKKMMIGIMIKI